MSPSRRGLASAASPCRRDAFAGHARWLEQRATRLVRSPELARDLVQETFVSYLKQPPAVATSLRGWLDAVMRNQYRMWCRTNARRLRRESDHVSDAADFTSPDESLDRPRIASLLGDELDRVPEPYRETLRLRYYEGLTPAQIALRLALPQSTVRRRSMVGLQLLRARLEARFGNRPRALEQALRSLVPAAAASRGAPTPSRFPASPAGKLALVAGTAAVLGALALIPEGRLPSPALDAGDLAAAASPALPGPGPGATPAVRGPAAAHRARPPVRGAAPDRPVPLLLAAPVDDEPDLAAPPAAAAASLAAQAPPPALSCGSLQRRIDAAPPGATVSVPPCVFREALRIDKPVVLEGEPGSEVRGSDVFTAWQDAGGLWRSERAVPHFPELRCTPTPPGENSDDDLCVPFEQVFVDGRALERAAAGTRPAPGQFALDAGRHVLLPEPPQGHLIEVTVRRDWARLTANDVTVRGLTFRHALAGTREPAFDVTGERTRVRIEGNLFALSAGHAVRMDGSDHVFAANRVTASGGAALTVIAGRRVRVEGNLLDHNGLAHRPDNGWVTGGLRLLASQVTAHGNRILDNAGIGILSVHGRDGLFTENLIVRNAGAGLVSFGAERERIESNLLRQNGHGHGHPGMFLTQTRALTVAGNTLIEHARGIELNVQDFDELPEGFESCASSAYNRIEANTFVGAEGVFMTGDPRPARELPPCPSNVAFANQLLAEMQADEPSPSRAEELLAGTRDAQHAF